MMKKVMTMALSLMLLLGAAFPTVNAETALASESDRERMTDVRISIQREKQLMQEAGLNLDEWDSVLAERKREALRQPLTTEALRKADSRAEILEEDGRIFYIVPNSAFAPVESAADAFGLACQMLTMLGGTEETDLRLWSKLGINGQTVWSFQEIADSETVLGSTLKIALDENNEVTAVFSNILPEDHENQEERTPTVSRKEAERAVLRHAIGEKLLPEFSERTIRCPAGMAEALDLESENEEIVPEQLLWVIYTSNSGADSESYPYLAHYVKLDGTWLFKLSVKQPGDEESLCGFRKQDVFAEMTADEFTGEISDMNGRVRTVTLPVMKNRKTGEWALGDVNRRIAVADFYEAAYQDDHPLHLVTDAGNSGWDNEDLYMYYNYLRAWDFYADMGWIGPDGQGTDVIILKGLAYRSHTPYENACSIGSVEAYQMFGYAAYKENGTPLGLVKGLDVMAHEYTHTFTNTVMNENLYENDQGAINEAMSDIMGNLVEYICQDTDDSKWLLGENAGYVIRSMSEPRSKQQPACVWDLYYGPHTLVPKTSNDRGGVHSNSSLLNRIAALLCLEHGMSYEEAVSFWMTVAMGMTPKTDYRQIHALLDWAAEVSGNGVYREAIDRLIAEERLDMAERPVSFPEGQKMAILKLPGNETFEDDNWSMIAFQLDSRTLGELGSAFVSQLMLGRRDPSVWEESLQEILKHVTLDGNQIRVDDEKSSNEFAESVLHVLRGEGLLLQMMSWEENDTGEIPLVEAEDYLTLHMLINISAGGSKISGLTVLIGTQWVDLMNLEKSDMIRLIPGLLANAAQRNDAGSGEKISYLPTDGLEAVRLSETGMLMAAA